MVNWTRRFAPIAVCCASITVATGAYAANFPERPVHIIVGMSAGGGTDAVVRPVAQKLSEKWGQPVLVDFRPGASGSIAADFVAHAKPDGYTLAWITNSHTIAPTQFKLNYDPVKSFAPITETVNVPLVLVVNPSLGVNSLKELIALAKANPGKLNFGSSGVPTGPYLDTALLLEKTGAKMTHVPFKGGSEVVAAMLGGEVQVYFAAIGGILPQIKSGALKALAISTKARSDVLPDVPSVAEAVDLPEYNANDWHGVLAPAGTPKEIVAKLQADIDDVIKSPETRSRLREMGLGVIGSSPEEFTQMMDKELVTWAALLKTPDPK